MARLHSDTHTPRAEYYSYWLRRPSFIFFGLLIYVVGSIATRQWGPSDISDVSLLGATALIFLLSSSIAFNRTLLRRRRQEEYWYQDRGLPVPPPIWRSAEQENYFAHERDIIFNRFFGRSVINTVMVFALNGLIITGLSTIGQPYNGELWFVIFTLILAYSFAYGVVIGPARAVDDYQHRRLEEIERDLADGRLTIAPG